MNRGFSHAFTLIELLVVIAIIGVLASIVIVGLNSAKAKVVTAGGQIFEDQMHEAYGANAVALWNFDDGPGQDGLNHIASDSSGNHNDLTIDTSSSNGPSIVWASTTRAFRGASAIVFPPSNTSSNPAVTNLTGFNPSNGSISFWINLTDDGSQQGVFCTQNYAQFCIVSGDAAYPAHFIQALWSGGFGSSKQLTTAIGSGSILGKWTHVALSWNVAVGSSTGTMNIYVNGNQVAAASYAPPTSLGTAPTFCVGGDCMGDNMVGTLDEMRVYSQSLQSGEVEKIYAEGLPRHELAEAGRE